jgi:hypothetical protein
VRDRLIHYSTVMFFIIRCGVIVRLLTSLSEIDFVVSRDRFLRIKNWKRHRRIQSWPVLSCYTGIFLEVEEETTIGPDPGKRRRE